MRNIISIFCFFFTGILFLTCSDEKVDEEINIDKEEVYAFFLKKTMVVNAGESQNDIVVNWNRTTWEITIGQGDIIKSISLMQGGSEDGEKQYTKIKMICHPNATMKCRTQILHLTDKTNNTTTDMLIEQDVGFKLVSLNIDADTKYQSVVGFGGMYNPKIWCGENLISSKEMERMYGEEGLGYSILRLMIYPNESDWSADVEGAKIAQANGAVIFACPWDCTTTLSEKIKVNGKEVNHLKKENYGEYADHLIRYINYMKQQGVNIYAISVQNEPDMNFTYWTPAEMVDFINQYGSMIRKTGVKLMSPEACGTSPDYTDPIINDAGAFSHTDIVSGHLYQGFIDLSNEYVKNRYDYICKLYSRIQGKMWWMTEHLFNDGEKSDNPSDWEFQDWSYCLNHIGKEIHMCMEGYCSAYIYWYLKRFYGLMGDRDERSPNNEGEITKNGYIMAHYAQYATNKTRIKAVTDNNNICATAYINENEKEITLVLLNLTSFTQCVTIDLPNIKSVTAVETNEDKNMEPITLEDFVSGDGVHIIASRNSIISVRLVL